jgi:glycosyltransferase involved in cell wall biosynthesis
MTEHRIGVVVIGRNEGQRLKRCLASIHTTETVIVYVDSGSTDGSPAMARSSGADVVDLDLSRPFTAARARNEGFHRLVELCPDIEFVQFVDGDCEVNADWLDVAREFLLSHKTHGVVCGRRRERFPEQSIYNRMCDEEWDTPIGDTLACGGDAMMRVAAIKAVNGYRESLIAGEEPELCFRLRNLGWRVHRLDREMTLHDAAMTRIGQWWKRTLRSGHAFAEGAWLHGATSERFWVRETRRALIWGLLLPLAIVLAATIKGSLAGVLALAYPLQWLRLTWRTRSPLSSAFMVLGKLPEAWGVMKFHISRWRGTTGAIIEYK